VRGGRTVGVGGGSPAVLSSPYPEGLGGPS
jgi:hypothetical protein